ncbi:signal recognition particle-docking protein FtsY [Thioclava electrotropha]|uniref:Signal recognition particle receptor FtsY n=1 Tax=Thioclava electrotropha TaxID=1549850 RepID=A0ABX6YRW4_9RHOB|nr:signal recognition particle-docking protein FtsY [Thioclava electrotropha]QPZ90475.1 signal recognition particle-docking protein FtsY [Thioclava electrotropha]
MSFFKKLKSRLTRSSSKLEQGLEDIVAENAASEDEVAETPEPFAPAMPAETSPEAAPQTRAEPAPEPEPEAEPEPEPEPPHSETINLPDPTPPAPGYVPAPVTEPVEEEHAQIAKAPLDVEPAPERPSPEPKKPGLLGRIFGGGEAKVAEPRRVLDDEMLESLEELLIASDMGVDTALRVSANLAEGRMGRKLSVSEIKGLLAQEVARIMEPVAKPLPLYPKKPQVVLVVGVNGSGKTTTIGKLASQFRAAGKRVVIAAGDTFRAAAVEQLQVWGDRAGVPVLTAPEGSDPASLAYDAMKKAEAEGADLLMIDTAGRLQNRADLMEELAKIVRVIRKVDETAPHNTLLVLDATTGQNALQQVDVFRKISNVSGLVMTKLDGTAKGGVLVALADKFGLPIHAIGVGEQLDDLAPFDPEEFAQALVGLED